MDDRERAKRNTTRGRKRQRKLDHAWEYVPTATVLRRVAPNRMQTELMYRKPLTMTAMTTMSPSFHRPGAGKKEMGGKDSRESIHSGHFMVSDFEAEAQDDEDELAVPVPDEEAAKVAIIAATGFSYEKFISISCADKTSQQLSIETSLNKLFQCMSLAYR